MNTREPGVRSQEPGAGRPRSASRITRHASRITFHVSPRGAFTLIELLVVIAIMGILAAIALPNIGKMKPSVVAAATQQLLTDVGRARQLAINHRTTVYMVFVPTNFWANIPAIDMPKVQPLLDKQMTSYTFVSLRSIGDQPGRPTPRYLSEWKSLPDGTFFPQWKFWNFGVPMIVYTNNAAGNRFPAFNIDAFRTTTRVWFPDVPTNNVSVPVPLPYIAFDSNGQLVDDTGQPTGLNAFIPIARGTVNYPRDANKVATAAGFPVVSENPAGNSTNAFTLINVDWLTGRPRAERQEIQ